MPTGDENARLAITKDLYVAVLAGEQHLNTLMATYRGMATVFSTTALSAVGYVISKRLFERTNIDGNDLIFILFSIGIIHFLGTLAIFVLDGVICQRLMDGYFFSGLEMENNNLFLPRVHNKIRHRGSLEATTTRGFFSSILTPIKTSKGHRPRNLKSLLLFYAFPIYLSTTLLLWCVGELIYSYIESSISFMIPLVARMVIILVLSILVWPSKLFNIMINLSSNRENSLELSPSSGSV